MGLIGDIGDPVKDAAALEAMLRRLLDGAKLEIVDGGFKIVLATPPPK